MTASFYDAELQSVIADFEGMDASFAAMRVEDESVDGLKALDNLIYK